MLVILRFLLVTSSITHIYTTAMDFLPIILTNDDQEITNYSPSHPTSGGIWTEPSTRLLRFSLKSSQSMAFRQSSESSLAIMQTQTTRPGRRL